MSEIVNLRARRKAKNRLAREKEAEANRVLHGLSRAERSEAQRLRSRAESELDAHKLVDRSSGGDPSR